MLLHVVMLENFNFYWIVIH
ncbi:hypothetical protein BLA29_014312 [Euroglyphus maynei]|uniref:Uncharacterized protein n=1 Tax=Euroglyphus maynei TaxID=6958 RepID=A0A1Y3AWM4_EURMA|nr:hypothetical protein BLA29_014312 [Euroglyphus maynei]